MIVGHNEMKASRLKRRLLLGAGCGVASLAVTWLLHFESSPLKNFFTWHVWLPNQWTLVNVPALFLGIIISGNHSSYMIIVLVALFLQWFAVGWVLSLFFIRR